MLLKAMQWEVNNNTYEVFSREKKKILQTE